MFVYIFILFAHLQETHQNKAEVKHSGGFNTSILKISWLPGPCWVALGLLGLCSNYPVSLIFNNAGHLMSFKKINLC